MLLKKRKKNKENDDTKKKQLLITINVLGSAGPIRFVVNENDNVADVIDTALRLYARQGRLPVLGSDAGGFLLYPANAEFDALSPSDSIGSQSHQGRSFVLCKKQRQPQMTEGRSEVVAGKVGSRWKAWLNKSFSFKTKKW